jgi:hypothetical protein
MPTGPSTNKTEFQRYLNAFPDACPSLRAILKTYRANPHFNDTFGFWLRVKHRPKFDFAYTRWWLRKPSLFGKVYEDNPELESLGIINE